MPETQLSICAGSYRKYLVFAVTSLALFMSSVNSTVVATALPSIQSALKADLGWTSWVITAYQLVTLIMMPLMGRLSDEWGRKRVFIAGVAIFTIGSFLCSISSNIFLLIISRFLQALGGSSLMPSAMGIIGDHFSEDRARAIGLFSSIFPIGGIVGPAIGGWLLEYASWRYIFLINIPVGVFAVVLSYFLLKPDEKIRSTRVDFIGAGIFAISLLSVMYFFTRLGKEPFYVSSLLTWVILGLGALLLFLFFRWESAVETPILEMALFKNRTFTIINGLNLLYGACVFGLLAFIPYYAQLIYGFSNLASGTLLMARAFGMIGMSVATSIFLNRLGYRTPMMGGFLVLSLSLLGLSFSLHSPVILGRVISDYWWLAVLIFLSGMGVGLASPSSNNAAIELMPGKIAAISGLRGMFRLTGGVIGTSIIVLVLSRYPDKADGFHVVFLSMAIILLLAIPLIKKVPDGRSLVSVSEVSK